MEIKVNEEIRNIKETFLLGLSLRQMIWSVIAILSAVGMYFLIGNVINQRETTIIICMITAAPSVCIGYLKIQGMPAEKIFIEILQSYVINTQEIPNKPQNAILDQLELEQFNSPEAVKKRKKKQKIHIAVFVICICSFLIACVIAGKLGQNDSFSQYRIQKCQELKNSISLDLYDSVSQKHIEQLFDELDSEVMQDTTEKELTITLRTYKNKLNAVETYPQAKAKELDNIYGNFITVNPQIYSTLNSFCDEIKSAPSIEGANELYDKAVYELDSMLKSANKS